MLPLLLLLVLPSAYSQYSYIFDGVQYTRQTILTTNVNEEPVFLSLNPKTDQLYFNLVNAVNDTRRLHTFKDRKLFEYDVSSIMLEVAAVDVTKDKLYIGTTDGVIILDGTEAEFVGLANQSISYLFKPAENNKLFAIVSRNHTVYEMDLETLEEKRLDLISSADIMVTDREGNIFYYNEDGLYVLLKGLNEPSRFIGAYEKVSALTVDHKNRVIVAATGGLYWLKTDSLIPVKLMKLDFYPSGVVFKNDEIYISRKGAIYKFTQ